MAIYKSLVKKVSIAPEKKTKQKDYLPKGALPIIDQGQQLIGGYANDDNRQVSCNLPVIVFGDHTRAVKYVDFPFGAGADGIKVLEPVEGIYPKFLYYATQYLVLRLEDRGYARHYQYIEKKELEVPSVPEQKRIVARIEELFSELDNGVETLQKTKQQLTVYRQAVLKDAYEGVFTQEWRTKHPENIAQDIWADVCEQKKKYKNLKAYELEEQIQLSSLPDSWMWVNIGDISRGPEYGTSQKSLEKGKVPVVRMGNLQKGIIDWTDLVFSNDDSEIAKYHLAPGDVLFNRTNSPELVGKTSIYRGEREAIFAGYLIRINQFACINAEYLTYYMNSFTAKHYGNKVKTDGVNQSNINGKKLCSYPFPLCSQEEQAQVVHELESRLSVCDSIEKTVDTALQQAEAMRQSILKQAFEGRL